MLLDLTRPSGPWRLIPVLAGFVPLVAMPVAAQIDRITGSPFATRSDVIAPSGMVATSHPLATQIGVEILKAGGTAADAAIAVNAALGLMEPVGCGIGGDMLVMVWDAGNEEVHGLIAAGRSPLGLSYERMRDELRVRGLGEIPPYGMLPVSVPGTVDGWFELHERFGRLSMEAILQPAIDYAENGFPLTELIAHYWHNGVSFHGREPGPFRDLYTNNGRIPAKGEIFRSPDLAATYRKLAAGGRDVFYRGEITRMIDAYFRENGGYLRFEDFDRHRSEWVEPNSVDYRGYDVFQLPPNTQGIAALQMLNILEGFDLRSLGFGHPTAIHLMIEAKKLAFEDRARYIGDPEFSAQPIDGLLSKSYASERRHLIDPDFASRRVVAGFPPLDAGDTISFAVGDRHGNMIAVMQSKYRGFGSGIVVPGTGFSFQDRGQVFTMEPGHPNTYAPGKRPFHTNVPVFVKQNGRPWLAFGFMGGPMQPQGHVQFLTNIIDFDMGLQEASDASRWQHHGSSEPTGETAKGAGHVELESGFGWEVTRALQNLGHRIRAGDGGFGGLQAVMWDETNGVYFGASESRKDGHAAGY